MPYFLRLGEASVQHSHQFTNDQGDTECVEFVRQATGAPHTTTWKRGVNVMQSAIGSIKRGTAIATFDGKNVYPLDGRGKHAAIYLSHSRIGIVVLDQWNKQQRVLQRTIHSKKALFPRSNSAENFFVIE